MTVSVSAATILPAPGNPHWDGDTGIAVWDDVPNSGSSYSWQLYRTQSATASPTQLGLQVEKGTIRSDYHAGSEFKIPMASYLAKHGNAWYYFCVRAEGDGINYTASDYALSDGFAYTGENAPPLPTPLGLAWKLDASRYYATWSNLADYDDTDVFTVHVYDESGTHLEGNTLTKAEIKAAGYPGMPLAMNTTKAYARYYFTVQADSMRPNRFQSSDVSAHSSLLTIGTQYTAPPITNYDNSGSSSGGSSGGGFRVYSFDWGNSHTNSSVSTGSTTSSPVALTAGDIEALISKANAGGSVRSMGKGEVTVEAAAWTQLTGYSFYHDTVADGKVQVRVTINNPASLKQDLKVSGYTEGKKVNGVSNLFNRHFSNNTAVIQFDQAGEWGQEVEIAAKLDLTGMNTGNLIFYSYDSKTGKYMRIQNPKYWVDEKGYLHFYTRYAGSIVVSDDHLRQK